MNKTMKSALIFGALAAGLVAGPVEPQQYADRFLVAFRAEAPTVTVTVDAGQKPVTGILTVDELLSRHEVVRMERWLPNAGPEDSDGEVLLMNIYRVVLPGDRDRAILTTVMADFTKDANVLYAEPENINRVNYSPNDTRFNSEWHLPRIMAPQAWDLWDIPGGVEPGSRDIVLASVDTGVQYNHPDLRNNAWINQDEIPAAIFDAIDTDEDGFINRAELVAYVGDVNNNGTADLQDAVHDDSPLVNGVDDDTDGYVDDILGWDIAGTTSGVDPDRDPMAAMTGAAFADYRAHGTHVAGILAAETDNGAGVAATIFNGSIMAVKCMYDQDANGYVSGGYSGILYAAKAGADIINLSWGSFSNFSSSEQSLINTAYNTYGSLVVAAAGNGNPNGTPNDNIHYPSAYDNVVSVTAVSASDVFSWATYGSTVDLSAPGEGIWSTVLTNMGSYDAWPGTSMASPLVASSFGLLKSMNPDMSNDEMVDRMLAAADPIDDINPNYAGGLGAGRINVYNALAQLIFPALTYSSHSLQLIDDDGDNQLSAGESAYLRIALSNAPNWMNAENVTGMLSSTSPFVTILDSLASFSTIQSGNIGSNLFDTFHFELSEEASTGELPFTLHLQANQDGPHPYEVDVDFTIDVTMWQANFPIHMRQATTSGNAVVDLNGDGEMDIVFGAEDSLVHAYQQDGSELPGFPVLFGSKIEATPAIGDVDNDGDLEVVIGSWDRNLYLIQHDGTSDTLLVSSGYLMATPTLVNLDDDPELEIIQPGYNQQLAVINHDGTPLDNFPVILPSAEKMTEGVSVVDLDNDGELEIIVGTWGSLLHAFKLDGTEVSGFPVELGDRLVSAPTVANIDNTGGPEIVIGSDNDELYAVSNTGEVLWTFSDPTQNLRMTPGVGDITGDGMLEIFFTSYDRNIYALDHTGELIAGWPVLTGSTISSSPVLADVDNDGLPEVFVGSDDNYLYGLSASGEPISGFPIVLQGRVRGTPTVANLDDDGDFEVIIGSDSLLAVVDIKTAAGEAGYWATDRGNLMRTGVFGEPFSDLADGHNFSIPSEYELLPNYPNPFNPTTTIRFTVPVAERVELVVRDIRGRRVNTLYSGSVKPGEYAMQWNGLDESGLAVSSGVYVYQLITPAQTISRKMLFMK
ncbi:MAG: S8 family serine peptidase [Lentisphaeria bacterium]|nr:S8 family serine peptidase [Candidatus Neomarinimicrobiota bacterium]MCF7843234.1 S8 family serine peptidase [Lentisphaeria bacterium]